MSNKVTKKKSAKLAKAVTPAPSVVEGKAKSPHARPSRASTKHVGGYFHPAVSKQLRHIAVEEDSSVQALLGEALDMLFISRHKPTIATKPKKA